ncbi:MAG: AMP-binding protein [Deltaproteobacteria bacterium]|nr:AMP-binding protein [Deltaproteobacteria bacterium]MBW1815594.1 AMP-binding protein [Deltaproteobacteria bacterium]
MSPESASATDIRPRTEGVPGQMDTLPKLLRRHYREHPDRVAMRDKDQGIWIRYTWKDYYEKVRAFCLGLVSLGLEIGDKISILGENKPEWFWAEMGAQCARGAGVGIFADCVPSEVKFYVEHSDSKFVVCHDQEQVDKLLEIKDELPLVKKVIYWDPKGLWSYDDPILMSFDQVLDLGRDYDKAHPELFDRMIDEGIGEDIAVICYTSGTTGLPKGAMLSQGYEVEAITEWSKLDSWYKKGFEYLSFIPPAWATEQALGISGALVADVVVNFPEEPETVQENIREIGPELLFYGAKLWESVNRIVQAKMIDSTRLRRFIYRTFLPIGLKTADIYVQGKQPNAWEKFKYFVAYQAVFRSLRDRLGLSRVKVIYSAGGALSPEIVRYFKALGIEIKLFYGSTEMGIISNPRDREIRPESSGRVVPWADVKISDEGEILARSPLMYAGYYKNPEATKKKLNSEGWYCSEDFGHLDDQGHLIVIDRMEDLKPLAGGKQFSPQYAEVRLRFSPYIKDVLVVGGENRTFVSALINIDIDNMGRYAEANHIPYTTFTDLSQKPEVIGIVKEEIAKINQTLPEHAWIKRFVNLHKEFDADEAELTRTRKLRRTFVEERYGDLISALYGDESELTVEAPITYQDGRQGVIKTTIKVNRLEG